MLVSSQKPNFAYLLFIVQLRRVGSSHSTCLSLRYTLYLRSCFLTRLKKLPNGEMRDEGKEHWGDKILLPPFFTNDRADRKAVSGHLSEKALSLKLKRAFLAQVLL